MRRNCTPPAFATFSHGIFRHNFGISSRKLAHTMVASQSLPDSTGHRALSLESQGRVCRPCSAGRHQCPSTFCLLTLLRPLPNKGIPNLAISRTLLRPDDSTPLFNDPGLTTASRILSSCLTLQPTWQNRVWQPAGLQLNGASVFGKTLQQHLRTCLLTVAGGLVVTVLQ